MQPINTQSIHQSIHFILTIHLYSLTSILSLLLQHIQMGSGSVAKEDSKSEEIILTNTNDPNKQHDNTKDYTFDVIEVANVALAIKKEDPHIINVELSVGLRFMPAPKAFQSVRTMIKLFKKVPELVEIGRTQSVRNELNPNFLTTFLLPYSIGSDERVILQVWNDEPKNRKLIGQNELAISNYMEDKPSIDLDVILEDKSAKEKPKFYISCSGYNGGGNSYEVQLEASGFHNSKSEIFVVIEVLRDSDWIPVAKSRPTSVKNNPKFEGMKISSHKFGTEETSRIRFRCYQSSLDEEQLGFSDDITLTALINSDEKDNTKRIEKAGVVEGKVSVTSWKKINQDSFLTYIINGARLHLILGIDYTNSTVPLHQQKREKNLYEMAIKQIVGMLQYFDYYNQIALYGFGAKLPPHYKSVGQCFALNGNYFQPLVTGGVEKIISLYRQNLSKVKPHGPSKLSEIINMAIQFALSAESQTSNYYVLIVLTDGSIDDYNDTIDKIIEASNLPLSIVLVGLGNGDFSLLKKLDQDNNQLLVSAKTKQVCKRDMIGFIDFKEYQLDEKLTKYETETNLARKTFSEIPKQFVSYMQAHHVRPNKEKKAIKAAKGEFLAEKISIGKKKQNQLIIPKVQFLKEEKKRFVKKLLSLGLQANQTFEQTLQISMYDQTYFLQIYASKLPAAIQQQKTYKQNISFRQEKKFEEQLQRNEKISNHHTQNEIFKRDINQIGKRQRTKERPPEITHNKQTKLKHPCLRCRQREICIIYGQCGHLAVCEQCQEDICIVCHENNDHFYNINQQH